MGNSIERNNIKGHNNQFIGGNLNYITMIITHSNDTKVTLYRQKFVLNQIKQSSNLIKTSKFDEVIKQLESKNAVMLVGCSGIGKTYLSYAVSNSFIENHSYNFRFVSTPKENSFDNIFNIISEYCDDKEVIIIDDFLGNFTLDLSTDELTSLEKILKTLDNFKNKKFIFTTRKTILQQLVSNYKAISSWLKANLVEIDLDSYEEKDKLEIFLYYCKKNDIAFNIKELIDKKIWNTTLNDILVHKNYTPLIIRFATESCKKALLKDYSNIFLSLLEHPEDVWEKEIKALDSFSWKYMNILLSLSNSGNIKMEIADKCFKKYIEITNIEANFTFEKIHDNIKIFIKSDEDKNIYFVHPSLIEYLDKQITEKERENIINSALYLEQIEKMDNTDDSHHIVELMNVTKNKLPKILSLKVMPLIINYKEESHEFINIIWTHYLKYLYKFKINDINHEPRVIEILKHILDLDDYIFIFYSNDIINTFSLKYDFSEILESNNNLLKLFKHANTSNIWYLINADVPKNTIGYDYSKMKSFIQESLLEKLKEIAAEQLDIIDIEEYVNDEIDIYDVGETFDYDDIIDAVRERIYDDFNFGSVKKVIEDILKKHSIYKFNDIDAIKYEDIFECFWENELIEDEITDILDQNYALK